MTITNKQQTTTQKTSTKQSDIIITADGQVHISFLWDDLAPLAGIEVQPGIVTHNWKAPDIVPELLDLSDYADCSLCPKSCHFNRTHSAHPQCGTDAFRISNVGISYGDEFEIKGQGGSGILMFAGCPLTCPSCHNPEKVAHGEETSIKQFLLYCEELLAGGAENIQILSPTVHLPKLRHALSILKASGFPLPIVFKSSGYEKAQELKKLEGLVDVYLPDLKFGPCSDWGKRAGVEDYFAVATLAIAEMCRQVGIAVFNQRGAMQRGVMIRHVKMPLPDLEQAAIKNFVFNLPLGVHYSFLDDFVALE